MKVSCCVSWLLVLALVTVQLASLTSAVKWLSIATVAVADGIRQEEECDKLEGLVKRQRQICRRNVELMDSVKAGAADAIVECQFQFQNRRWNCSTVDTGTVFGKIIKTGTRETAFVHAISAAGVAHAVTRACSSGRLERCGCDRTVDSRSAKGFQWAGCSDNIAYGSAFSKSFVDARETRAKNRDAARALMNLHNNNAGRKAIENYMRVQCKCHGVSGSCELKTCWRSMPSFRDVGNTLKDKFDGAVEVEQQRSGSRRELVARNAQFRAPTDSDLVFLDASPDFCDADPKTGSLGTRGRLCSRSSKATDGCELMCCGRGFQTRRRVIVERCHCKFHWCCYVRCQKCRMEVEEHVCR